MILLIVAKRNMHVSEMSDSGWALYIIMHHVPKKDIRSKGGLEPLSNERSIGLKPTLQTPEAHRCQLKDKI